MPGRGYALVAGRKLIVEQFPPGIKANDAANVVVRLVYHALNKRLEQQFGKNAAEIGIAETLAAPGMKVIQKITGCESAIPQCAGASALVN